MTLHEPALELFYGNSDECFGPFRVVHKLPALPCSLVIASHYDFLGNIVKLTARALLQVHGSAV
jgi:hypothetical protein